MCGAEVIHCPICKHTTFHLYRCAPSPALQKETQKRNAPPPAHPSSPPKPAHEGSISTLSTPCPPCTSPTKETENEHGEPGNNANGTIKEVLPLPEHNIPIHTTLTAIRASDWEMTQLKAKWTRDWVAESGEPGMRGRRWIGGKGRTLREAEVGGLCVGGRGLEVKVLGKEQKRKAKGKGSKKGGKKSNWGAKGRRLGKGEGVKGEGEGSGEGEGRGSSGCGGLV